MAKKQKKLIRKKPIQKRAENTVTDILEAATKLLNELGEAKFHQFGTTELAKKCGVSIGTLYQYFPDKETILAELLDHRNKIDMSIATRVIQEHSRDPLPKVISIAMKEIINQSYIPLHNLYRIVAIHRDDIVRVETNAVIQEKSVDTVQQLLEARQKEIGSKHPRHLAFLIVRTYIDVLRSIMRFRPEYVRDPIFIDTFCDFMTSSLQPKKS